ncbi:MAG: [FeFe] hydrogenase H-cluster radical SAM maturase HydE [Acidobacteriales bacterium]|nr:[FeFe] hydrogenase H-cluster radical SAM maturase HydE [Terriglobales bacterium]
MHIDEITNWLKETGPARLDRLYARADSTRRQYVGDVVHFRGLIEVSNYCVRSCTYCGVRAENLALKRYRLSRTEILDCAKRAAMLGYGTVVLQGGEDYGIAPAWFANIIRHIKQETNLAVTLSMGERNEWDLAEWREAGADRYLLRYETSDQELYRKIHPTVPGHPTRLALLRKLRQMGYEIGSGVMIGIPGQSYASLANDIALFRELDLDMIGVGPYIPHPATPLGNGSLALTLSPDEQVPATEDMSYKVIALTRLACPDTNIPSTTALATINAANGRELGLQRGANVVMPNLTPVSCRPLYEIYPSKACVTEEPADCSRCLRGRVQSIGRRPADGPGNRRKLDYRPQPQFAF